MADEEYPAWLWTILDSSKSTAAAAAAGGSSDRKGKGGKGRKNVEVVEEEVELVHEETGPRTFDFAKERKKLRAA